MNPQAWAAQAEQALQAGRFDVAVPLLRKAADAGHGAACQRLAQYLLHFEAESGGAEALARLAQAQQAGHPAGFYIEAVVALGGRLLPADPERIARALLEAARLGMAQAVQAVKWLQARAGPSMDLLPADLLAEQIRQGLEPVPMQVLSDAPRVAVAPALLSEAECRLLMDTASPRLRPSTVHDPNTEETWRDPLRSSSDCSLDPLEEDFVLRWVQARMAATAGCSLVQAEHLVVLHYAPGQEYRPHTDDLNPTALQRHRPQAGQRFRTLCAYLHPVEQGGQTEWPRLGLKVEPVMGSAVIFDNLNAHGQPDPLSLHAGAPVQAGRKWLATLWWRQRAYRPW